MVEGLDCPDCAKVLELDIAMETGVKDVHINFLQGTLSVEGEFDLASVYRRIQNLGYRVKAEENPLRKTQTNKGFSSFWEFLKTRSELKLVLVGIGLLLLSLLLELWDPDKWVILAVQLLALVIAGYPVFQSAIKGLVSSRSLNINFLMSIAAVGAVIIGEPIEAIIMLVLFSLSEAIEGYSNDRVRKVLKEFTELAPQTALVVGADSEKETPVAEIRIGDRMLVRAGERIPLDGIVVDGVSEVNQAPITGESQLIRKEIGDKVFSGTVNGQSTLLVEVTSKAEDTTIQQIINLVTEAQEVKAKSHKFIDQFARYYTPAIVVLALLLAIVPPLFFGQALLNIGDQYGWLHRALSLLVIGCPCALVISTPVTIISSLIRAARSGVVFKGGIFIEKLARVKLVAFDKTGTLTRGKPVVTQVRAVDCDGNEDCAACQDMLAIACALEKHSSHPLRTAILAAGEKEGVIDRYPAAQNLETLNGRGIMGEVNGQTATIGSLALFRADHQTPEKVVEWVRNAESDGLTTMLICDGNKVRGFISVADEVRPESIRVVDALRKMDIKTIMLTGDNPMVAQNVANSLKVDEIRASLLPKDKLSIIKDLISNYQDVAMVGDGINDSPAMAASGVGMALNGASNGQVLETADVVLLNDDLSRIPFAIRLSKFSTRLIKQNIAFSLSIKFIVAVVALLGLTPLWVAVLADMGVSLLVTLNGMRALRFQEK